MKTVITMLGTGIVTWAWLGFPKSDAFAQEKVTGKPWEVTVAIGLSLTEGNSKNTAGNAALDAARVEAKNEWRSGVSAAYAETEDPVTGDTQKSAQNAKVYVNYKRKLKAIFLYSDNSVLHDELAELDYRAILGAGAGRYFVDSPRDKASVEAGAAYVHETLADGGNSDSIALRVAQRWERKLSETSKVWQWVEYLPRTEDFGNYLINAELGIEAALDARLSLRVVAKDAYTSDPAPGRKENDMAVVASLLYKLR
ncbi:MAG: DUF481 domain-containing protein [Kiritimatiellae bacterium]|nr:DUF481 domain-containing protein [Kiritimatiellia bacterium]